MSKIVMRLYRNSRGFWQRYRWFIAFFLTALMLDTISTIYFMQDTGTWRDEIHPIVALSSMMFGTVAGPFIGSLYKAVAAILLAVYFRKLAATIFTLAGVLYVLAYFYNLWAVELYAKNVITWLPF